MKLKFDNPKGFIAAFMMMGAVVIFALWLNFERSACIHNIKVEFSRFQNSLTEAGYDISYSDLSFNKFAITGAMTVKGLRINNLNADDYVEFYTDDLQLSPSFFSIGKVNISVNGEQRLTLGENVHQLKFSNLSIFINFCKNTGLRNINIIGQNIEATDIIKIGELKLNSQYITSPQTNYTSPFFENHLEARNMELLTSDSLPVSKKVDHIYLDANIVGTMKAQDDYKDTITTWLNQGGIIDIPKLTINWDYFNLVGKGDIYFNENIEPIMHLNTSSKGLLELMNAFQNNDYLDSKGTFVAKILLGNKAFKLKDDDQYLTLTTPIDITPTGLSVEGINIKKFE